MRSLLSISIQASFHNLMYSITHFKIVDRDIQRYTIVLSTAEHGNCPRFNTCRPNSVQKTFVFPFSNAQMSCDRRWRRAVSAVAAGEQRGKTSVLLTHQQTKTWEEERQPLGSAPPHNVLRESRSLRLPLYGGVTIVTYPLSATGMAPMRLHWI